MLQNLSVFEGGKNFLTVCFANIVFESILKWSSVMGCRNKISLVQNSSTIYTIDATGHLIMIYTRASIHFGADNKFKQQKKRKEKNKKTWYEKRHVGIKFIYLPRVCFAIQKPMYSKFIRWGSKEKFMQYFLTKLICNYSVNQIIDFTGLSFFDEKHPMKH